MGTGLNFRPKVTEYCLKYRFFTTTVLLLRCTHHSTAVCAIFTQQDGCGTCGGTGCASRGNDIGLTGDDCCAGKILASGRLCSVTGEAPCFIDGK